jgi:hypothetical protein
VTRQIGERLEPRLWTQNNHLTSPLDEHLCALEPKVLRQTHCLTASVLEELGRLHIYIVYLHESSPALQVGGVLEELQRALLDRYGR